MSIRPRPPGYHCFKALRRLGFDEHAIAESLRRELALDTGEIQAVLAYPITPRHGVPIAAVVDITDKPKNNPRRRRTDVETSTPLT